MTRLRDPFRDALEALRRALIDDGLAPGQHLPIAEIARALGLSTSPVREALSRLCGEGLVEDKRGFGYFTPTWPAEDIATLFRLEASHVALALSILRSPPDGWTGPSSQLHRHLRTIVNDADSGPLRDSYLRVADRLAPVRRYERTVFPQETFLALGPDAAAVIEEYYRERIDAASAFGRCLRGQSSVFGQNIPNIV